MNNTSKCNSSRSGNNVADSSIEVIERVTPGITHITRFLLPRSEVVRLRALEVRDQAAFFAELAGIWIREKQIPRTKPPVSPV